MVFSSISKGRCFGLCVGCWFGCCVLAWVWVWFFSFSNALLLSLTFRNDIFINLSRIGLDFVLEWSFHQFQKVGALVWVLGVGLCVGCWLGFGFGFFHSLTPYSSL